MNKDAETIAGCGCALAIYLVIMVITFNVVYYSWNLGIAPAFNLNHISFYAAVWVTVGISVVGSFFRSTFSKS